MSLLWSERKAETLSVVASIIAAVVSGLALIVAYRSERAASLVQKQIARERLEVERIQETAVLIRALEVFGDSERALQWMRESNPALKNEPPIRVIQTEAGQAEVLNVLGRIQHGVIS